MKPHAKYLSYVIRHKWFVLIAGVRLGVPLWRLIIHDFSKFSRAEWGPYTRRFYGGRAGVLDKEADPEEFHIAWNHHWHRNSHHWEHWLRIKGTEIIPMRMSFDSTMEMVADWLGAGRAITGEWGVKGWYGANKDKMILHDYTRVLAESLLSYEA